MVPLLPKISGYALSCSQDKGTASVVRCNTNDVSATYDQGSLHYVRYLRTSLPSLQYVQAPMPSRPLAQLCPKTLLGPCSAAAPAPKHSTSLAMTARKLKLPIPVTILTGSLGVGKTTALCKLVAQKPADEVWCCIVNEFGAVGIDAVAIVSNSLQQSNVVVKQIAGGCMCCVLSGPLSAAIAQVIRQVKPDRVIIEPSGLGHPGGEDNVTMVR